ncbi:MAG: acyl-CoA dehydrogenase [Hamadaea sp.]|nr:acyl-CoA dehydrogenase [Hamadaea sp.]
MNFAPSAEQQSFVDSLHKLLADADGLGAARAWAAGDTGPGQALWRRLDDLGVTALALPEEAGGLGAAPIDWVLAGEELGHHAVPGAVADRLALVGSDARALAGAAQLLGAGRALLETTVEYAGRRTQFGRPIGSFQAVQHQLADALIGIEFARPLLWRAAVCLADAGTPASPSVSAAKVACAQAADRAARTAIQVHGAIGYTLECDVSVWFSHIRALIPADGTPPWHRARIAEHLRTLP